MQSGNQQYANRQSANPNGRPTSDLRSFRVKTGLVEFVVEANDRRSAIQAFRQRLSRELPRLWDVIHELSDDQFSVSSHSTDSHSTDSHSTDSRSTDSRSTADDSEGPAVPDKRDERGDHA